MTDRIARGIATFGGVGLLPWAPGTAGSLAALPAGAAIMWLTGPLGLVGAAGIAFAAGIWAGDRVEALTESHDPGHIVIDEVAGQWLTLAAVPLDWLPVAAAFLAFRCADIAKPWPARWADRHVGGGLGVMLDDILAGGLAAAALVALNGWGALW